MRRLLWLGRPLAAILLLASVLLPVGVSALAVPPAPTDIPIVDQTNTLSEGQKQTLAAKIAKERSETGNQIAVLMVKSLEGESLEDYSLNVARGWGIGQKERNSGVLLLVAKDDHRLRIEVGYGLEGALPDARASHIINDRITPQFKQAKFYEGIDSGLDGIITAIHGEKDPNLKPEGQAAKSWTKWIEPLLFGIFVVPIWLGSILARTKSWWAGGVIGGVGGVVVGFIFGFLFVGLVAVPVMVLLGLLFDKLVSDNYRKAAKGSRNRPSWWAGGPWIGGGGIGGGGSGGFGGFSGGSFGGGGSSGSW
jgi:uncharacterized protein